MRIAVLADIHGNSAALDAVVADLATAGADLVVTLGDDLSGPLDARGTAERLMALGWPGIAGNHDRLLVSPPAQGPGSWERPALEVLEPTQLAWLAGRPASLSIEGLLLCHGTPQSDVEPWLDRQDGRRMRPATAAETESPTRDHPEAAGFLCAHTHVARFVRLADGRPVLNPGSVGCPAYAARLPSMNYAMSTGAPDARYAILERRGDGWRAELRSVPYDASAMVALARKRGEDDWVSALTTGRVTL